MNLSFTRLWLPLCLLSIYASCATAVVPGARELSSNELFDTMVVEGAPAGVIYMDEDLPQLLWVDLKNGSMYRLKQSRGSWFAQSTPIPISLGKQGYHKRLEGDLKTPVGIYHVTSYLKDSQLAPKYGDGAFPFNYPSAFDRLQNRTGSGIWLHGLPKGVATRPRLDSDGCVVVDNKTLGFLKPLIEPQETMVVLSEELHWWSSRPGEYDLLMSTLKQWLQDWQSLDADRYLAHYAPGFTDFSRNLKAFKTYKTRVNARKEWIEVSLNQMSVLVHPEHEDIVSVRYHQDYRSSNYNWRGWKQMLWQIQADGAWQIIYEGN